MGAWGAAARTAGAWPAAARATTRTLRCQVGGRGCGGLAVGQWWWVVGGLVVVGAKGARFGELGSCRDCAALALPGGWAWVWWVGGGLCSVAGVPAQEHRGGGQVQLGELRELPRVRGPRAATQGGPAARPSHTATRDNHELLLLLFWRGGCHVRCDTCQPQEHWVVAALGALPHPTPLRLPFLAAT